MKRTSIFIMFALIFTLCIFAHPGRTDANGGHWDRSTGEYHFHDGRYAGRNQSGSSSGSDNINFVPPYEPPTDNPYKAIEKQETQSKTSDISSKIVNGILSFFNSFFICGAIGFVFTKGERFSALIYGIISTFFFVLLYKQYTAIATITTLVTVVLFFVVFAVISLFKKADSRITAYEKSINALQNVIKLKKDITIAPAIPSNYEIGDDGLPKELNANGWGKSLTFYTSPYGQKIHHVLYCSNARIKNNIFQYHNKTNISECLCQKCCSKDMIPDMIWYSKYLKYKNALDEYSALPEDEKNIQKLYENIDIEYKKCNSIIVKFVLFLSKNRRNKINSLKPNFIAKNDIKYLEHIGEGKVCKDEIITFIISTNREFYTDITIRTDENSDTIDKWKDAEMGCLFVIGTYTNGNLESIYVTKDIFEAAYVHFFEQGEAPKNIVVSEEAIKSILTPPTLNINDYAFADDETQNAAVEKFAEEMYQYAKCRIAYEKLPTKNDIEHSVKQESKKAHNPPKERAFSDFLQNHYIAISDIIIIAIGYAICIANCFFDFLPDLTWLCVVLHPIAFLAVSYGFKSKTKDSAWIATKVCLPFPIAILGVWLFSSFEMLSPIAPFSFITSVAIWQRNTRKYFD